MARTVPVYIADIDAALLTYTQVRLYTDTAPDGAFSTLADTDTLVADQHTYYMVASAAGPDTWYAWRLYNPTGPVSGDLSSPFQLERVTFAEARLRTAALAGQAFDSVCTANGTTTALIDAVLRDNGVSDTFLNASWIDRYPVSGDDRLHRMAQGGFDPATGALIPLRPWSVAPSAGDPYAVYGLMPPIKQAGNAYSWDDALRDGLQDVWYNDEVVVLDTVTEDDARTNQIPLDQVPWLQEDRIRAVWAQRLDDEGRLWRKNLTKNGRYWEIRDLGFGVRVLVLSIYPLIGWSIVVSALRQCDEPYTDTDIVPVNTDVATSAGVMAAYRWLNRVTQTKGQYEGEYVQALRYFRKQYAPFRPKDAMVNA